MNWTCEQTEARLSDYLDGLFQPTEQSAFNLHVNTCERCAPLVAAVARTLGSLYALEPVEPPPQLENAILTATLGAPSWRNLRHWLKSLRSPRFVYSMVSVAATLVIILSASGFSFRKPKLADLHPAKIYRSANSHRRVLPTSNLAAPTTRIRPRPSSRTVPTNSAGICGCWRRNSPFCVARLVRGECHEVCRPFRRGRGRLLPELRQGHVLDVRAPGARRSLLRRVPGRNRGHPCSNPTRCGSASGIAVSDASFQFARGLAEPLQIEIQ